MNQPSQVISDPINTISSDLKEIGRVPLLDRDREIEYGRQIQTVMKYHQIQAKLAQTLRHELSLEEWAAVLELTVDELAAHLQAGDIAKRKMTEANLRLPDLASFPYDTSTELQVLRLGLF